MKHILVMLALLHIIQAPEESLVKNINTHLLTPQLVAYLNICQDHEA